MNPKSILVDNGSEMELTDFARSIPSQMFDFIIFESRFISGIDVVYELWDKTKYIVASLYEIISPGFTLIYVNSLQHICKNEKTPISFAKDYFNHYDLLDVLLRLATISVIDTSQLDELALFISAIGEHREFSLDNI